MNKWTKIPDQKILEKTAKALEENGIGAFIVQNGAEAKRKVLELIPKGAEVFTMASETLNSIGIPKEINESGDYDSIRIKLNSMNRQTQGKDMQKLGAAPDYTIGSVHAVTWDGKVLVASNTGSQLSAYVYGSSHVVWVVGAQKVVKDLDKGMKRIYEYVLPLEDARMRKAHGMGSNVSKLLIFNKEVRPGRLILILVKEVLGF